MPTLSITKSYNDTEVLTAAMIDDLVESIEAFFNTEKLDGDNIQAGSVTTAKIAASAVTTAKIDDDAVTADKIVDNIKLVGDCGVEGTFQVGTSGPYLKKTSGSTKAITIGPSGGTDYPALVSYDSPTHGLKIIRGAMNSAGTKTAGEGFTCAKTSTGTYTITITTAFANDPAAVAILSGSAGFQISVKSTSTSSVVVETYTGSGTVLTDSGFHFMLIAQRDA